MDPESGHFCKSDCPGRQKAADQDGQARDDPAISITVSTPDGIELEPASTERADRFTREITVTETDKVVDITFGNDRTGMARAAKLSTGASEEFPEVGDKFTGTCTVKSVIGGNGPYSLRRDSYGLYGDPVRGRRRGSRLCTAFGGSSSGRDEI